MNVEHQTLSLHAGQGIQLQPLADHHAEEAFALIQGNREHLSEWLPWVGRMQTTDDFRYYIRHCRQQQADGTDYGYIILHNHVMVGRIGIHYIHKLNKSCAIGYWLGKKFEGKGIITTACTALIEECFTTLGLNRIEIKCGTGNSKSAAIPERLGFTKEGVLRQAEWVNGGFIDLALYSLLKEDWQVRF
jgi:ribosomal-protein-serine acetyltransferase